MVIECRVPSLDTPDVFDIYNDDGFLLIMADKFINNFELIKSIQILNTNVLYIVFKTKRDDVYRPHVTCELSLTV